MAYLYGLLLQTDKPYFFYSMQLIEADIKESRTKKLIMHDAAPLPDTVICSEPHHNSSNKRHTT